MKTFRVIVAIATLIMSFSACERVSQIMQPPTSQIESDSDEFTVGVILPLTGHVASTGQRMKAGIDLALNEINSSQPNTSTLKFIIEDDASTPEGAVAAVNKLIHEDRISVILGFSTSSATRASFPIAQENQIVAIAAVAGARGIGELGNFVFRLPLTTSVIIPEGVKATQAKLGYQRVATLYDKADLFSTDRDETLRETFAANSIEVLTTEVYQSGDTDFSAQLTRIKALNPDAIFVSALPPEKPGILIQGQELGISAPVIISSLTVEFVLSDSMPQNKSVRLRMIDVHGNISESPSYSVVKPTSFPDLSVVEPDLVMLSPQVSKATLAPGESFTFSVTVKNDGDGPSGPTTLRYYYRASDGIGIEIGTDAVSPLASKGTSDASIQLTALDAPGTYTYSACVGSVPCESNTDNNCTTAVSITVAMPPEVLITVAMPPEVLVISAGNDQNGMSTIELTDPFVVKVLDADNNGVAGVRVTFRVTTGRGQVSRLKAGRACLSSSTTKRAVASRRFPLPRRVLVLSRFGRGVAALDPVMFHCHCG